MSGQETQFAQRLQQELSVRLQQLESGDAAAAVEPMDMQTYWWAALTVAVVVVVFVLTCLV